MNVKPYDRLAKKQKERSLHKLVGYPTRHTTPDTALQKRAPDTPLHKLVISDALQKRADDVLDKLDAGGSAYSGLRKLVEICPTANVLGQVETLMKIQQATDELNKRIEVLQNQPAPSRMAKMDAGGRGTAHKGNAENMAGEEIPIITEDGERHLAAELIKGLHAGGAQLEKNE